MPKSDMLYTAQAYNKKPKSLQAHALGTNIPVNCKWWKLTNHLPAKHCPSTDWIVVHLFEPDNTWIPQEKL
jgi:hypothetical protein